MASDFDSTADRRRYARVKLLQPLKGRVADATVFLVDASVCGVRIAHQDPIGSIGETCNLLFSWEGITVTLGCRIRRTTMEKPARSKGEKPLYHSGLEIEEKTTEADGILRQMIQQLVVRALDEQRANARGIPAVAAHSFQTGKASEFLRCELVSGQWKTTRTRDPEQPKGGFTVSADEEPSKIEMLQSSYAAADFEGRQMIRTFAALSISTAEGIPTRRYMP
ncbi:MAG TPA: PilZ domain-containing protein [Thermoanaerobaculia bacterium]|nr:PilZ domain-containing protein [Thermoanaerobaculia bacterium]